MANCQLKIVLVGHLCGTWGTYLTLTYFLRLNSQLNQLMDVKAKHIVYPYPAKLNIFCPEIVVCFLHLLHLLKCNS